MIGGLPWCNVLLAPLRTSRRISPTPEKSFLRWDDKAGLRRDAIRSQWSTRSKRNRKETGYEED
jgi:hypothetical protein